MKSSAQSLFKVVSLSVFLAAGIGAYAADPVTDMMQAANAPYRMALFKTNGKVQEEALAAVQQGQAAWNMFTSQFSAKPPAPYDRDAGFAASAAEVSHVYAQAIQQVTAGQLTQAHNTLERVRDVMADMRQRNGVVVYSDHMNAYHAQMEKILVHGGETLAQPKGMLLMTAQVGALRYLASQLDAQASAELKKNEEFNALLKAVNQSVLGLEAALLNQDMASAKDAASKLKGPYSKLFAKFG